MIQTPSVRLATCTFLALALAGCSQTHGSDPMRTRTGPAFAVAFPDASVLVTTPDPSRVRAQLATVQLPATQAHDDELLALLHGQQSISAAHFLLLVEAVAPPDTAFVMIGDGDTWRVYPQRGQGRYADTVDRMFVDGTDKLVDVDRRTLGELIGRTQSDATLVALAERFAPALDDGSEQALIEIVDGMPGSPAMLPFLTAYLAPRGGLDGSRGWALIGRMPFDDDRLALLQVLASSSESIDSARLLQAVDAMSFDSGRSGALDVLVPKVGPVSGAVAQQAIASFSFDSGRRAACAALAGTAALQVDDAQLVELTRLCSFDSARLQFVEILGEHLHGEPQANAAMALLSTFSFDAARLQVLERMAPRWRTLPSESKRALVATFSFSSSRERAAMILL